MSLRVARAARTVVLTLLALSAARIVGLSPSELVAAGSLLPLTVAAGLLSGFVMRERRRGSRLSEVLDEGGMSDLAEQVVASMSDGLAVFDEDGRLVGWNAAAQELTGWTLEQAEQELPRSTPEGLVPLGEGRWLRAQAFTVRRGSSCYRAVLFSDASDELRALQQRESLEQRVLDRTEALERTQLEVLERLSQAAELRDDDTGDHTRRVGRLAAAIADELGLPADEVELIRRAAPLHDVGKIGVPDELLLKPARLTDGELERMRDHTVLGARILSSPAFPLMRIAEQIALCHHERWDGGGYPQGLRGDDIPIAGRIVAVADVYDALTHTRPYKTAWTCDRAVAEITRGSGTQFDRDVVVAFLRLVARGVVAPHDGSPTGRFQRRAVEELAATA